TWSLAWPPPDCWRPTAAVVAPREGARCRGGRTGGRTEPASPAFFARSEPAGLPTGCHSRPHCAKTGRTLTRKDYDHISNLLQVCFRAESIQLPDTRGESVSR